MRRNFRRRRRPASAAARRRRRRRRRRPAVAASSSNRAAGGACHSSAKFVPRKCCRLPARRRRRPPPSVRGRPTRSPPTPASRIHLVVRHRHGRRPHRLRHRARRPIQGDNPGALRRPARARPARPDAPNLQHERGFGAVRRLPQNARAPRAVVHRRARGLAAGAAVPFVQHLPAEHPARVHRLQRGERPSRRRGGRATTTAPTSSCATRRACAVGHNEDNDAVDLNRTVLVGARFGARSWTAYTYLGELPSGAFGFNANVAFTLNWVGPTDVVCPGLGRGFVSRALLDAADLALPSRRRRSQDRPPGTTSS